jgi:hypothetical protein
MQSLSSITNEGNHLETLIQAIKSIQDKEQNSPQKPLWLTKKQLGIPADESECAEAIGFSVHWLRKDRRYRQIVPFFTIGSSIRYDIGKALEAITALQRGGSHIAPRTRKTTSNK